MRRVVVALVFALAAQSVSAADMPDLPILRGSFADRPQLPRPVWQGFYVGGQVSHGAASGDPKSLKDLTEKMLDHTPFDNNLPPNEYLNVSTWPLFTTQSHKAQGFGGFVGYNSQWDDAVVGFEANYTRSNFRIFDQGTKVGYARNGDSPEMLNVTYTGTNNTVVSDMGSLRVRGGYAWNGFLLPYGFIGLALGVGSSDRTANLYINSAPKGNVLAHTLTERKNNAVMYGYSVGAGIDMMLVGGLFGRVEYEYSKFAAPVEITINTVRVGAGYKF